ncbi:hypothetical protein IM697_23850 [Streptomyces ferrugineus]|uniref:Uncharacterized protein n=1 Tax=Streptomyces ferrugineus TaxID=1413221 RepID=A0A7M2SAF4_9ACTN|nr:hypothetical protein [Streptomyces ferrugineus]QOV33276.1 hypothetical protein IM697_23850 [Streptomyces ferrugineus]
MSMHDLLFLYLTLAVLGMAAALVGVIGLGVARWAGSPSPTTSSAGPSSAPGP